MILRLLAVGFAACALMAGMVGVVGPLLFVGSLASATTACNTPEAGTGPCEYPHCSDWRIDPRDYVKNPSVSRREYWAVARNGSSAYLFPRPDGFRTIAEECNANGPNAELFRRYSLCTPASSSAEVARVNGMSVEDALAISSALHEKLVFQRAAGSAAAIEPFPYLDDELAVCGELGDAGGVLQNVCARAFRRRDGASTEVGYVYSAAEIDALIPLLNKLYGVR